MQSSSRKPEPLSRRNGGYRSSRGSRLWAGTEVPVPSAAPAYDDALAPIPGLKPATPDLAKHWSSASSNLTLLPHPLNRHLNEARRIRNELVHCPGVTLESDQLVWLDGFCGEFLQWAQFLVDQPRTVLAALSPARRPAFGRGSAPSTRPAAAGLSPAAEFVFLRTAIRSASVPYPGITMNGAVHQPPLI